jgi:hypothetical protein
MNFAYVQSTSSFIEHNLGSYGNFQMNLYYVPPPSPPPAINTTANETPNKTTNVTGNLSNVSNNSIYEMPDFEISSANSGKR